MGEAVSVVQVEAQTVFSQALQAGMHQLAKDVRSSKLQDPASPAEEMMDCSATLLITYEQLQVASRSHLMPPSPCSQQHPRSGQCCQLPDAKG